jgi:hypothetical protein
VVIEAISDRSEALARHERLDARLTDIWAGYVPPALPVAEQALALALTEAGLALQRTTLDVLDRVRDTVRRIRQPTRRRSFTVTTTVGFASLWLVPRLPRFTALRPDVDVRLSAGNRMMDLERDDIDVIDQRIDCCGGIAPDARQRREVGGPALAGDDGVWIRIQNSSQNFKTLGLYLRNMS